MCNFLFQNLLISPNHMLLTIRINTSCSWGIGKSCSGGIRTFWTKKIIQKKSIKFTKSLNYIKFSGIISVPKCPNNPQLYTTDTNLLLNSFLYVLHFSNLLRRAKNLSRIIDYIFIYTNDHQVQNFLMNKLL